ncbi:MAG: hypothetical protein MJ002_06645 [Paludibacteraceae bacterium]|nr:hypothetical protein [Paludibacteraceae bacterium]
MKGFVFIDRNYDLRRSMITELLSSDAFRNSEFTIHLNISRDIFLTKWNDISYGIDESDTLSVLASSLHSLNWLPNEIIYDGDSTDYSNIRDLMKKVGESAVLNSIFCLPSVSNLPSDYGIEQVRPACESILRQPPHRPIRNGEAISWRQLLPDDHWNSIIIVDGYILKDKQTIDRNLFPILDKGHARTDCLQISIFTQFTKGDRTVAWEGAFNYLKQRYTNASIEIIDVRNASREIHDRNIITNHYMLYVPGGCDLLDASGHATKRTSLACYRLPLFFDMVSEEFLFLCQSMTSYRTNPLRLLSKPSKFKNRIIF